MNSLKTALLLGAMTGLLLLVGQAIGGNSGMLLMLVIATIMNLGSWFFSDQIVIKATGARPVHFDENPALHHMVADIALAADIPKPLVYIIPNQQSPNAFATGRSPAKGVVAVTPGLLTLLNDRQLRGVIAHEIGHIANRDTFISAVAATIAGVLSMLSHLMAFGLMSGRNNEHPAGALFAVILAPIIAGLTQMAISRTREYAADKTAAELTQDPEGLAQALEKIAYGVHRMPLQTPAAQAVHFITPPQALRGLQQSFSTHPPTDKRIAKLRMM